jgi:hypothetical protein
MLYDHGGVPDKKGRRRKKNLAGHETKRHETASSASDSVADGGRQEVAGNQEPKTSKPFLRRFGSATNWLLGLIGALASIAGLLYYYADKRDKVANIEEQLLIQPEPGHHEIWSVILQLDNLGPASARQIEAVPL